MSADNYVTFRAIVEDSYKPSFRDFFNTELGLNVRTRLAAISIDSPVCGLRPHLAAVSGPADFSIHADASGDVFSHTLKIKGNKIQGIRIY